MTLLFVDGFDHYVTADFPKKWTNTPSAVYAVIHATEGRRGGGAYKQPALNASVGYISKTLAASATWVIGFAVKFTSLPTASVPMLQLLDVATLQCSLVLQADGTLAVVRGSATAVTNGASAVALASGIWHYVEFKVTIADSITADSCKVRLNGADIITVATGQDLKVSANASASQFWLGLNSNNSGPAPVWFDDVYVCNQAGSVNNDFLGDIRVDVLYPTSDGNYTAFTPSTGSSHYALVDETAPNTSDYNSGSAVNDRDSYGLSNLSALSSQTVYGVQVNSAILKDDAGAKSAANFVRSGSTDTDGASAPLGTAQSYLSQVFELDPNTAAAWTESTVNAMEAGVKVTA